MSYKIVEYVTAIGENPFREWLKTLSIEIQARIQARVARFEQGNLGDVKSVGFGVFEARLFFGSGYRIYFSVVGRVVVLILVGGDKSRQNRDILLARKFLDDFKRRGISGKKKH